MEGLLPNGSVVLIKDTDHRVMIYGRIQKDTGTGKVYDYAGCFYPEGLLDSTKVILFNREDIDMVFFIGFQDIEELAYREELYKVLENNKAQFEAFIES